MSSRSMDFRSTWSPIEVLSSRPGSGRHSTPPSTPKSERANHDLETALHCLVSVNPTTWSQKLVWVEYAHNTLPCLATGLSPFECSLGYQPPLVPEKEEEVRISSAQKFVRHCRRTWKRAWAALLKTTSRYQRQADRHRTPTTRYLLGHRVKHQLQELQRHPHGVIGRGADNDEDGYHQSQDESEEESGRPPGQRYQFLIREVRGAALIDIHIIGARGACNGCWKERTKTQRVAWVVAWPSSALVEAVPGRTTPLATTRCGRPTGRIRGCCASCRAPRPTRDQAALVAPVGDPMEDEGVGPLSASTTVPSTDSVSSSASRRRTCCVFFSFCVFNLSFVIGCLALLFQRYNAFIGIFVYFKLK
ncbi:uncharacterized protein LOC118941547 [Oncorhynchus mykiss]|uniref:uncharacterized protein LOC118941547 n=1 Tax=Oncorhynchus mykiss TaxID=8022 RepID=UPI001878C7FC|nr:uncharacterized protein LOC118941547 [Oncorhynchus mykiss]